jgi:RHS repeat-associated protein
VIDHDTGELVEAATYQPYGAVETDYRPTRWGNFREDVRYTGQWDNSEVGLIYFNARYYAPNLGRFISPDPQTIHKVAGDPNPYAYAYGSPLRYGDPSGLGDDDSSGDDNSSSSSSSGGSSGDDTSGGGDFSGGGGDTGGSSDTTAGDSTGTSNGETAAGSEATGSASAATASSSWNTYNQTPTYSSLEENITGWLIGYSNWNSFSNAAFGTSLPSFDFGAPAGAGDIKMYSRPVGGFDWLDHLYLLWEDGHGAETVFEGGPQRGDVGPGTFNALFGDYGKLGAGYDDYSARATHKLDTDASVVLLTGPSAVQKCDCLVQAQGIINTWNVDYRPWGPNSNTVAYTFCALCNIPFRYPDGSNPWGYWADLNPDIPPQGWAF